MSGALVHVPSPILLAALGYAGWRIARLIARAIEADDFDRAIEEWERARRATGGRR